MIVKLQSHLSEVTIPTSPIDRAMKLFQVVVTALLSIYPDVSSAFSPANVHVFRNDRSTFLRSFKEKIMSDIDIMCISNAAELCSLYDECNLEEREAILNRFDEQTDVLSERLAMMLVLSKHLETGERPDIVEEVTNLKQEILKMVTNVDLSGKKYTSEELLEGSSVRELKDEIMTAIEDEAKEELQAKGDFLEALLEDSDNKYDAWLGF